MASKGDWGLAEQHWRAAHETSAQCLSWEHPHTLATLIGLSDVLEKMGKEAEALSLRLSAVHFLVNNISSYNRLSARQLALTLYKVNKLEEAERLLQKLIDQEFEIPGTYCHLARLHFVMGREAEARTSVDLAWTRRAEAPLYVLRRILWFQAAFALLDAATTSAVSLRRVGERLGNLKTSLQEQRDFVEWSMQRVLDYLRSRLDAQSVDLLYVLVAALGDPSKVSELDRFAMWCDAAPQQCS